MALLDIFPANWLLYLSLIAASLVLRRYLYYTDTPHIRGLAAIPGWPLLGSLVTLGDTHAKQFAQWSKQHGPVYQVRLGTKRVVVANTYESVKKLWINNQSALVSRPTFHTFHSVVSSSQGFTIGTSPWDESLKRRRKVAATALNRPAVESYMPIVDLETNLIVSDMFKDGQKNSHGDINPVGYIQRFALNTSLTLNYGLRIGGTINDALLREVVTVEKEIGNLRSTSHNWQDYVPLLRLRPSSNDIAKDMRVRRDKYMTHLLSELRKRIAAGTDKPCITGNILKDPEAKLNEAEVKSLCISMVAGGLDTLPGNIIMTIGYLASPHGQEVQKRAFRDISQAYPNGDGYEKCIEGEKIPYIVAMVKEALRFWSAFQISLPRTSVKDVEYEGAVIPTGTTFYMNAWAANYDEKRFIDPAAFDPERYLKATSDASGTPHYGFGAGARMCIGSHLANREIYTIFTRLILAFEIAPASGVEDAPILDTLECGSPKTAMALQPKPFKVQIKPRNRENLEKWIGDSEARTQDCL